MSSQARAATGTDVDGVPHLHTGARSCTCRADWGVPSGLEHLRTSGPVWESEGWCLRVPLVGTMLDVRSPVCCRNVNVVLAGTGAGGPAPTCSLLGLRRKTRQPKSGHGAGVGLGAPLPDSHLLSLCLSCLLSLSLSPSLSLLPPLSLIPSPVSLSHPPPRGSPVLFPSPVSSSLSVSPHPRAYFLPHLLPLCFTPSLVAHLPAHLLFLFFSLLAPYQLSAPFSSASFGAWCPPQGVQSLFNKKAICPHTSLGPQGQCG